MDRAFFNANELELLIANEIPHILAKRNKKIEALRRAITLRRVAIPNTPDSFYIVPECLLGGKTKIQLVFYARRKARKT